MSFTILFLSFLCSSISCFASDRITRDESLRFNETIVSADQKFALGFFKPRKDSTSSYVGIWYNKISDKSIVWVANREKPVIGNASVLTIGTDGNLLIINTARQIIWSTNVTVSSRNSTAVLSNSGNLYLSESDDSDSDNFLWQSFDFPTDTYLPDMRVHMNVHEGERRVFTSWKTATDPSIGKYSTGVDPRGSPQMVVWEGEKRRWRSGHWNGLIFTGIQGVRAGYLFGFHLFNEGDGKMYLTYTSTNASELVKFRLTWDGIDVQERWNYGVSEWNALRSNPTNDCDVYNYCGSFGICDRWETPKCDCVNGFVPVDRDGWGKGNWSGGCVRRTKLQCGNASEGKKDGFLKVEGVKLPDFVDYVGSEDEEACASQCLEDCMCTAYAYVSGINCMIWNQDLVDVERFVEGGSTLHVRVAHSELGSSSKTTQIVAVSISVAMFVTILAILLLWWYKTRSQGYVSRFNVEVFKVGPSGEYSTDISGPCDGLSGQQKTELAIYNFNYVAAVTDNFSDENKLGQGGFGPVYKGTLPEGQEIAVKRLSRKSGQGVEEFKNEITLIAKLQHRNLVRLLGCCFEREEKILLYEYMPNKSLDSYIFDPVKKAQLDWNQRFTIIEGIARGLLYLHRDSRLRIIHRDLKASNILLDEEMQPKISDFGMARIFGGNQYEENTNRVVGTFGYMAPEYAMEGLFSLKSDVYSFGILLLEIITGRRNNSFRSTDYSNIIGYAWDFWSNDRALEITDNSISSSCSQEQVLRCIHVGMLCVQDMAAYRPNMSEVLLMLESEHSTFPMPRQPTFTSMRHNEDANMLTGNQDGVSSNNVTITVIQGR